MKRNMHSHAWGLTLRNFGGAVLLIGGGSLAVYCTMPEVVCLSLLAGDFAPPLLTGDSCLFIIWCLFVVSGAGIGVVVFDDLVGELTWNARSHSPRPEGASIRRPAARG
jgi:hypothetical protein